MKWFWVTANKKYLARVKFIADSPHAWQNIVIHDNTCIDIYLLQVELLQNDSVIVVLRDDLNKLYHDVGLYMYSLGN